MQFSATFRARHCDGNQVTSNYFEWVRTSIEYILDITSSSQTETKVILLHQSDPSLQSRVSALSTKSFLPKPLKVFFLYKLTQGYLKDGTDQRDLLVRHVFNTHPVIKYTIVVCIRVTNVSS